MKFAIFTDRKEIRVVRDLSPDEASRMVENVGCLEEFLSDYSFFNLIEWNLDDFMALVNLNERTYLDAARKSPTRHFLGLDLNRRLLNFMSSVRTYLDHTETRLKRRYGPKDSRVKGFKQACAQEYDGVFSYRFLYKLRNYAQHCGLPIGKVQIEAEGFEEDGLKHSRYVVSIEFARDELLSRFDWTPGLASEIRDQPEFFSVCHHIMNVMQCLDRIHASVIRSELMDLSSRVEMVRELLSAKPNHQGAPCLVTMTNIDDTGDRVNFSIRWVPENVLDLVDRLKETLR